MEIAVEFFSAELDGTAQAATCAGRKGSVDGLQVTVQAQNMKPLLLRLSLLAFFFVVVSSVQADNGKKKDSMPKRTLETLVGKKVKLTGQALNSKAGAIVVSEKGTVFIEGLESWPDEFHGREVTVSGKLMRQPISPESVTTDDGVVTQGVAPGFDVPFVIHNPKWNLIRMRDSPK